ncbi:hypothetical protein COO60DRAFT_1492170, partial [Scenedesmus sp. NREL 46B-D3]
MACDAPCGVSATSCCCVWGMVGMCWYACGCIGAMIAATGNIHHGVLCRLCGFSPWLLPSLLVAVGPVCELESVVGSAWKGLRAGVCMGRTWQRLLWNRTGADVLLLPCTAAVLSSMLSHAQAVMLALPAVIGWPFCNRQRAEVAVACEGAWHRHCEAWVWVRRKMWTFGGKFLLASHATGLYIMGVPAISGQCCWWASDLSVL